MSYKGVFGQSAVENGSSEMHVGPYRKIAENLHVDHSTVCRTVQVFEETGSVDENTSKKLDDLDEMGKRYSAIVAMCMDGVIDVQITTKRKR